MAWPGLLHKNSFLLPSLSSNLYLIWLIWIPNLCWEQSQGFCYDSQMINNNKNEKHSRILSEAVISYNFRMSARYLWYKAAQFGENKTKNKGISALHHLIPLDTAYFPDSLLYFGRWKSLRRTHQLCTFKASLSPKFWCCHPERLFPRFCPQIFCFSGIGIDPENWNFPKFLYDIDNNCPWTMALEGTKVTVRLGLESSLCSLWNLKVH